MCQYITIVLPTEIKLEKVKQSFTKHGLGCRPFQNKFVHKQIPNGGQLINTTSKMCDCDSVIASASYPSKSDIQQNDIERLKSKGWSTTKIKNWTESKTKSNTQTINRDQERDNWIKFLQEIIIENKIGKVGLYIHWYEDKIEDEEIVFNSQNRISIRNINGDQLDNLHYDILYEFVF
jgi:hypothetical protein